MSENLTADASAGYGKHLRHIQDAGFTFLLMSLGNRLGLFDAMMKENRPMSAQELAEVTHMKKRYIWEWLSGMAVGKIVSFDADNRTFFIPEETRFDLRLVSSVSSSIGMMTHRDQKIAACFNKDGPDGLNFNEDEYENAFWQTFSEMRRKTSAEFLETIILPTLKTTRAFEMLECGRDVLDAGCGSGELTIEFAKQFPSSKFTGLDLCKKPLSLLMDIASKGNIENVSTLQSNIQNLPESMDNTYDIVMMAWTLHNLPDPLKALSQVRKVLRKDGVLLLFEHAPSSHLKDNIGNLEVSMLHTWSVYYCLPSSLSDEPNI